MTPEPLENALARLRYGTEILGHGGGVALTAADCNALLDDRSRLAERVSTLEAAVGLARAYRAHEAAEPSQVMNRGDDWREWEHTLYVMEVELDDALAGLGADPDEEPDDPACTCWVTTSPPGAVPRVSELRHDPACPAHGAGADPATQESGHA